MKYSTASINRRLAASARTFEQYEQTYPSDHVFETASPSDQVGHVIERASPSEEVAPVIETAFLSEEESPTIEPPYPTQKMFYLLVSDTWSKSPRYSF
jgi:hypothetical protein